MTGTVWVPGAQRLTPAGEPGTMLNDAPARSVWHTTEAPSGGKYFDLMAQILVRKKFEPHLLYDPLTDRLGQFFPLDHSARALQNDDANSIHTNRTGTACIQIEVVAQAAKPFTSYWQPGPNFRALMAAIRSWGIPDEWPFGAMSRAGEDVSRDVGTWRTKGGHLGHCFPPGTLVGGPVPAAIEAAEEVTGHDGRLHKVTKRMGRDYAGPLVAVNSVGALPFRCTPEHPVLAVRPYRFPGGQLSKPGRATHAHVGTVAEHYRRQPQWMEAADLEVGDYLVAPAWKPSSEPAAVPWPHVAVGRAKKVAPLEPDSDTAWMLGFFAADGSSESGGIQFVLSPQDDVDRLVKTWRRYGLNPVVQEHVTYRRVRIASRTLGRSFAEWFGKSASKHLPAFIFKDGWPLGDVVQGLLDGDGTVNNRGQFTYDSISPLLCEQMRMALVSIGESPTVARYNIKTGYGGAKPMHRVIWYPAAIQHRTSHWRGLYLMPIKSLAQEHYEGPVYNLDVQDAHTYLVNGATVHNCNVPGNQHWDAGAIDQAALFTAAPIELEDDLQADEREWLKEAHDRVMGILRQRYWVVRDGQQVEVPAGTPGATACSILDSLDGAYLLAHGGDKATTAIVTELRAQVAALTSAIGAVAAGAGVDAAAVTAAAKSGAAAALSELHLAPVKGI